MKITRFLAVMIVLRMVLAPVSAQEWPQFLGPDRNGVSPQKGILRTWPQQGPEVLWSVNIGIGYGGPVVKDGKVFLLDRDDKVGDKLRCFDLTSGKELWNFEYNAPGSVMFPGSRSVPAVDGNRVYSCGPYGNLYCIDINTQKPLWNNNIWTDFGGGDIPKWAISQCPLIYGNLVIVASQTSKTGVVAYDKLTGKLAWTTPSVGAESYVSPVIVKVGGTDNIVMISASAGGGFGNNGSGGKVVGIEPSSGKIVWEYTNWQCHIPVPCAIDAGEGRILISGGYQAGSALIRVERKADGTYSVKELYKNPDFGAHTQPPVLVNGMFFSQYSTNERKDGLVCMTIDGRIKWKTGRAPIFDKGGLIIADGLIIATDGQNKLYLVEPDSTGFKPVATAELLKPGGTGSANDPMASRVGGATQNWAPIALADGRLLIRDQSRLICVKLVK
jgi:outer membrane protein assembly factor BamB